MTDTESIEQAVSAFQNLSGDNRAKLCDLNSLIQNHDGEWGVTNGGEKTATGATAMYWVESDPLIYELITFMYDNALLPVFNWTEWDEGSKLFDSEAPNKYENTDLETLLKIFYATTRKERFSEGTLRWAFDSGGFPKLVNRLVELGAARSE